VKDHGIASEDAYPYRGVDQSCKTVDPVFKISGFVDVPQNSTSQLIAALNQNTVSIAIDASSLWFQFYRSGVYSHKCGTNLDHGVLAVGYGNESGQDYYLVKNSWGASWGEKGYIKLVRNGDGPGECGIHLSASYPQA